MTEKRWVDRSRDSSLILMYHQPHRVTAGHWFKKKKKKRQRERTGKKERKMTEVNMHVLFFMSKVSIYLSLFKFTVVINKLL